MWLHVYRFAAIWAGTLLYHREWLYAHCYRDALRSYLCRCMLELLLVLLHVHVLSTEDKVIGFEYISVHTTYEKSLSWMYMKSCFVLPSPFWRWGTWSHTFYYPHLSEDEVHEVMLFTTHTFLKMRYWVATRCLSDHIILISMSYCVINCWVMQLLQFSEQGSSFNWEMPQW